ncbi:MAG: hypothetical protein GY903_30615 [Fuerstiella sp.]|nr:hypothetical protein [Fuerstiella sp.]MCP4858845.1 hypothetical protein [Fuerstiella sp.]
MKPSKMLQQMCHDLLTEVDVRALCKSRGFPPEAFTSRGVLETMFLSPQGLSTAYDSLDANEIALLHLLRNCDSPVGVAFFSRVYGSKGSGGTYQQRYKDCLTSTRQRLVRRGLLLLGEDAPRVRDKRTKLERCRFALPVEFHDDLPLIIPSPEPFEGDGNWRSKVIRDKLCADLSGRRKTAAKIAFHITSGALQLNGMLFQTGQLAAWQQAQWKSTIDDGKKPVGRIAHAWQPDDAVLCILSELAVGCWANTEQVAEPLRVFCDRKIDADAICEAGWKCGLLAKRRADGRNWYRLAPIPQDVNPNQCFVVGKKNSDVIVDLNTVPFAVLEQVVAVSEQQQGSRSGTMLLTPSFVKMGRASDELLATESIQWLIENTQPFAEAYVSLSERRGKTILHENVYVARITDLSLKVAVKKALGENVVALKNDFVAFPCGRLDDVQRVVKKSGYVVREVAAK